MDLSDLNIVAIAPAPKVQPVKRKKNNKYERRRQKAAKAKRETNPVNKKKQGTKQDNHGEATTTADSIMTEEENKKEMTMVSPTPVASPPAVVAAVAAEKTDELTTAAEKEKHSTELNVSSTPKTKPTTNKKNSTKENEPKKDTPKQKDSQESNDSITTSPLPPPSRRKRPNQPAVLEESEHAKYMAEYHARPMELDRRSGARPSSAGISKESKHLFVQEHKEWHDLRPRLMQTLTSKFQLTQPTTVQSRTIQTMQDPHKRNHNVLIHGETGSGKTLAYLLPILQQLGFASDARPPSRKELGTKCIILCPTRELASQTLTVVEKLCQANFAGWMVPGGLLGGDSRNSEKARVRKGLAILVATPGRLLDHLQKTESLLLNLKGKLQWLVLDEADRLLDMGLGDQVKQIVQLIRANEASKSQPWWRSVLVSATVTPSVQALAKERMLCGDHEWVWVKGSTDNEKQPSKRDDSGDGDSEKVSGDQDQQDGYAESTPRQLAQFHITVTAKLRLSTLVSFLVQRVSNGERTVVFMGTCASVDFHHRLFEVMDPLWDDNEDSSRKGLFGTKGHVFKLHGNVQHSKRNETLKHFDNAVGGAILLTTDVAARGLNLEGVDWTIQYDPPCEIADYVHRVGRVARAGKAGHSLLFLLPSEKGYLDVLSAKGISKVEPLSLSATLNKAASFCSDWTNAGLKHGGNKELDKKRTSPGMENARGSRLGEYFANEVQRRMEDCIVQDNIVAQQKWKEEKKANKKRRKDAPSRPKDGELLELARDAFVSFLRAYPTKREPSVRSIFSARALHVGHVARSFALKDPPKSLVSKHKQNHKANHEMEALDQQANRPKSLQFDIYENNLVSLSEDEHDDEEDDDDDGNHDRNEDRVTPRKGSAKRVKLTRGSGQVNDSFKATNAKALLLQNALKMQNNLMDAM